MSTPIGTAGRMPPGESWRRAPGRVARRLTQGSKKRYQIYGRRIEPGWWAYDVRIVKGPEPAGKAPVPMSRDRIAELSRSLPRCAQRSRAHHGGDSKVAWPTGALADEVARFLGGSAYRCKLPAPAIGEHWHLTTKKKRRRY
jgi:hypothetical protein